ncbi:MAG: hypothetical protein ABW123_06135 [Cystobacter sp.]
MLLLDDEKALLFATARDEGLKFSQWAAQKLLRAAKRRDTNDDDDDE